MVSLLTNREREVVELAGKGMTNKEIAKSMGISANTVHEYLRNLYRKNNLKSKAQAVAWLGNATQAGTNSYG